MEIKDLNKKEFKVNFTRLQESIKKCELDKNKEDCKKRFHEMGIEWYD